jgi:hypothetical protein
VVSQRGAVSIPVQKKALEGHTLSHSANVSVAHRSIRRLPAMGHFRLSCPPARRKATNVGCTQIAAVLRVEGCSSVNAVLNGEPSAKMVRF